MSPRQATSSLRPYLLLSPALVLMGLFFIAGLVLGVIQSFGFSLDASSNSWSWEAYRRVFSAPVFFASLRETLFIALVSTGLSAGLSVVCAVGLRKLFTGSAFFRLFARLPLLMPHLAAGSVVLLVLSQSGLLSRLAHGADLLETTGQFPELVYDPHHIGLISLYVYKETPFITLVLLSVFSQAGNDLEEAAQTLGASPWQRLTRVVLPLLLPGLTAASLMVFAFTLGAFEFPLLLSKTWPETLPVLAYRNYSDPDLGARPQALAEAVLIGGLCIALALGTARLLRGLRDE